MKRRNRREKRRGEEKEAERPFNKITEAPKILSLETVNCSRNHLKSSDLCLC